MIISLDLDGTLLDSNKRIPMSTMNFLNELKEKGEIIVINSGRCIYDALKPTESAWFANYILADTGSVIYDIDKKTIIEKFGISQETGKEIFEFAKNECNHFSIFSTGNKYYRFFNERPQKIDENCNRILDFNYIIDNNIDITHLSFKPSSQEFVDDLVLKLQEKFRFINVFAMRDSFGTEKFIEMTNKNAGKGKALLRLAEKLGLERSDIIVFGDAINDLEAITLSGIGVAMKNAIPEIKQNADYITEYTNDEAGVEKWLRKFYGNL